MKTQNSVSQKFEYDIRSIKKGYFKQKCQASEKYVHFYALNTGWASFCMIIWALRIIHGAGIQKEFWLFVGGSRVDKINHNNANIN